MEFSEKQLKTSLGIVLSFVLLGLVYNDMFVNNNGKAYEKALEFSKELHFNGVVVKKTRDKLNHNNPILILREGQKVNVFEVFYAKINVNDSIVKRKDSLFIKIFRNNSELVLNINDELKLMK